MDDADTARIGGQRRRQLGKLPVPFKLDALAQHWFEGGNNCGQSDRRGFYKSMLAEAIAAFKQRTGKLTP